MSDEYDASEPGRIPEQKDYAWHLAGTQSSLQALAAAENDVERLRLVRAVDWRVVANEFEPVVGRYRNEVYCIARKIIQNVRRPYMLYHHGVMLGHWLTMLAGALSESPSLRETADSQVNEAWAREASRDELLARKVRDVTPIDTLAGLVAWAAEKVVQHQRLAQENEDYMDCRRIPVPAATDASELDIKPPVAPSRGSC